MKFETLRKSMLMGAAAIFVWWAWKAPAQDTVTLNASAKVPYAVSQVVELEQAKIGDATVVAYIRNSGNNYNLSANDILYLRQQGVSDAVLTAMLTQSRASVANVAVPSSYSPPVASTPQYSPSAPAPDTSTYANYADTAPIVQPTTTYVQPAPTTYYYPYSYSYPYYSYYGYYGWPHPWYGWGWGWWGGGWHWGWGGHGGWNAGWHGGGGGSWHGSWGGGGFHGGVGGGFHGGGAGGFHGGGGGGFHGGGGHR
jgi:hypothetical protein